MSIKITGLGSYIPNKVVANEDFENHSFLNADGSSFKQNNQVIIKKFVAITGIEERRYAAEHLNTSDMAYVAAQRAIEKASCNPETIDYIIVSHNFGDVKYGDGKADMIPSLASRVKQKLQIKNPSCVAYDLIFGCPGWVEGVIQANAFIKAGIAKKCLVIGAESLSRVIDPHDRDSMIYADGAGASIIEKTDDEGGIFSHETASFTLDEANFIFNGNSYLPEADDSYYIKMHGRKIYEFALTNVPLAMKKCLDKSKFTINDVSKILIHQANEKMDEAIVKRFYELFDMKMPENIMPMCINKLGNSSVATVPTLYDLITTGQLAPHEINKGDVLLLASVGAGMNINAIVYQH
ncbi:3-oxoacyl-ACP synthase III family protein [Aquimarina agarilytica]|uniref:3-oxoacyl-ACP synthase III family protein n=1 Tax=Aquimarina agarilytica TaxID=1087449 RepID=UPI000288F489|nr:ketoacyl-ACP synthase III [Aquimarina agarilytica]